VDHVRLFGLGAFGQAAFQAAREEGVVALGAMGERILTPPGRIWATKRGEG